MRRSLEKPLFFAVSLDCWHNRAVCGGTRDEWSKKHFLQALGAMFRVCLCKRFAVNSIHVLSFGWHYDRKSNDGSFIVKAAVWEFLNFKVIIFSSLFRSFAWKYIC